ncbi:MAG: Nmad3 family putative nucleotide modification protein [Pirellulaceae bacterium]
MTRAVLLRVGIDSGSGGIQGPLFKDGSFEYICIPDKKGVSFHKYGTCIGKNGLPHSQYFPPGKRENVAQQHVHLDPEFETFTYGDPTAPKRSLRNLEKGDYLIFYAGLQNWDEKTGWVNGEPPALYIIGYFVVEMAGMAGVFSNATLQANFGQNFHVRYPSVFKLQRDDLVLVKGGRGSRFLHRPNKISTMSEDRAGKPLKVLSPEIRKIFGNFGGHVSIQRSPPRWVETTCVEKTIRHVMGLK